MKLDKIKKYLGNFGGISPPYEGHHRTSQTVQAESELYPLPATEESEAEYELRTQTAVGVFYGGQ